VEGKRHPRTLLATAVDAMTVNVLRLTTAILCCYINAICIFFMYAFQE